VLARRRPSMGSQGTCVIDPGASCRPCGFQEPAGANTVVFTLRLPLERGTSEDRGSTSDGKGMNRDFILGKWG
jgi:hypothetical protein